MTSTDRIKESMRRSPLMWAMYYLPQYFKLTTPRFHVSLISACMNHNRVAIAAPRESAKSSVVTNFLPSHSIYHSKDRFVLIVMNTLSKAIGKLEDIKKSFKDNPKLRRDCPISFIKDREGDTIFRNADGFECRILCKGNEQMGSIRGETFREWRPSLAIIDDLEDDEMVRSPERRISLKQTFDEALVPSVDVKEGRIIAIGTILHDDSLIAKLVGKTDYQEYKKLFYQAALNEVDFPSLWPQKWTPEFLRNMAKEKPAVFAKEMQNNPVAAEMAVFKRDNFAYWTQNLNEYTLWDGENVKGKGAFTDCMAAIGMDLAWEEGKEADYAAIIGALLTPESELLVESCWYKKRMRPDELANYLFELEARYKHLTGAYVTIGMEKAMLEKVTKWILRQEMAKRNQWLNVKDVKWGSDKISRIQMALEAKYNNKIVYHRRGFGELELQLERFPSAAHDDLPDALSVAVQLLQFPKKRTQRFVDADETFKKLQDLVKQTKETRPYAFGQKRGHRFEIPARKSLW